MLLNEEVEEALTWMAVDVGDILILLVIRWIAEVIARSCDGGGGGGER